MPVGPWAAAIAALLAAAACTPPTGFECGSSAACDLAPGGSCEADGRCSYADVDCASGRRFGGAGGECLALDGGADAASAADAAAGGDAAAVAAPQPGAAHLTSLDTVGVKTVGPFAATAGDVLVAWAIPANSIPRVDVASTPPLTWTVRADVDLVEHSRVRVFTATVPASGDVTVSFSEAAPTSELHAEGVIGFSGSAGVGAVAQDSGDGAPQVDLDTVGARSAVVVIVGDWDAQDGDDREWRSGAGPLTELDYQRSSVAVSSYAGVHADVSGPGSQAVGLSMPTGQRYSIAAIEILGR